MRSLRSSINKNLIENEEEQYWIEYINVRYHEDGISISQIARELNTCGIPTKRNGTWSHKQVSRILQRTELAEKLFVQRD